MKLEERVDAFCTHHPLVHIIYFGVILLMTACSMHPVFLSLSLMVSIFYDISLCGLRQFLISMRYYVPLFVLTVIVNPLFHHEGITILTYLPSGNPLTLESVFYGLGTATMLTATLLWFSCYQKVVGKSELLTLIGRVCPHLCLLLSMTLYLIPKFRNQWTSVQEVQKQSIRFGVNESSLKKSKRTMFSFFSTMTWALETSVITADSMKSRGYGLPGRTTFSLTRWSKRDTRVLLWLLVCTVVLLYAWLKKVFAWTYYPKLSSFSWTMPTIGSICCYFLFCLTPLWLNRKDKIR